MKTTSIASYNFISWVRLRSLNVPSSKAATRGHRRLNEKADTLGVKLIDPDEFMKCTVQYRCDCDSKRAWYRSRQHIRILEATRNDMRTLGKLATYAAIAAVLYGVIHYGMRLSPSDKCLLPHYLPHNVVAERLTQQMADALELLLLGKSGQKHEIIIASFFCAVKHKTRIRLFGVRKRITKIVTIGRSTPKSGKAFPKDMHSIRRCRVHRSCNR